MDKQMPDVAECMRRGVAEKVFPGGVLLAANRDNRRWVCAAGCANLWTAEPVSRHTVFDLASLTKPLATALAVMQLVRDNRLGIDTRLGEVVPLPAGSEKAAITVCQLLCHTSGFSDYRPYYRQLLDCPIAERKSCLHELLAAEPLAHPIGSKTVYSDIGFMVLQWVYETLAAKPLDRGVVEDIYAPLGIEDLFFNPRPFPATPKSGYAATERCPARGVLSGVVHDENAYATSGVGGHAGLFGTADAVCDLLYFLLCEYGKKKATTGFGYENVAKFFRIPADAERALGFDVPSGRTSSAGKYFTAGKTVGHLGFTGTSFWMDLQRRIIVILLTNRVHPSRSNERIKAFRPKVHDAVMQHFI
ncbi:MAG: serine hydrolase domain-containing protein [Thermodesulfobacteriota bacterium]